MPSTTCHIFLQTLLFSLVCIGSTSSHGEEMIVPVGIGTHTPRAPGNEQAIDDRFRSIATMNAKWVRAGWGFPAWGRTHLGRDEYDFTLPDEHVRYAEKYGLNLLGLIAYTPSWLKHEDTATPSNYLDVYKYVNTLALRYDGVVTHWEICNEPNLQKFFKGGTVDDYIDMLKVMYLALKDANSQNRVVGCSTAGIDYRFIERVLAATNGQYIDIVSIHPYINPKKASDSNLGKPLRDLRELLDRYNPAIDIWITEFGYKTGAGGSEISEDLQGPYIEEYFRVALDNHVKNLFVYLLRDEHVGGGIATWGLENTKGMPKPSYSYLKQYFKTVDPISTASYQQQEVKKTLLTIQGYDFEFLVGKPNTIEGYIYNFSDQTVKLDLRVEAVTGNSVSVDIEPKQMQLSPLSRGKITLRFETNAHSTAFCIFDAGGVFDEKLIKLDSLRPLEFRDASVFADGKIKPMLELTNMLPEPQTFELSVVDKQGMPHEDLPRLTMQSGETKTMALDRHIDLGRLQFAYGDLSDSMDLRTDVPVAEMATITVDGDRDDWKLLQSRMNLYQASQLMTGGDAWNGTEDLSGVLSVAFDDKYLYILADIIDDRLNYYVAGSPLWQGDVNLELFLDIDLSDADKAKYSEDDYKFDFALVNDHDVTYDIKHISTTMPLDGLILDGKATVTGYVLEIAIPLSLLNLTGDLLGREIGLNWAIDDCDLTQTREKQMVWKQDGQSAYRTSTVGKITFIDTNNSL